MNIFNNLFLDKILPLILVIGIYIISFILFPTLVFAITLVVFIFGFLVFIHEGGHFLAAKLNNVDVEEFAFGFGPKIVGKKYRETEYRINIIPLGGYVKMLGDEDPSSFKQDPSTKNNPRSYLSKKYWQKITIVSAGVIMNLIFAFLIFFVYLSLVSFKPSPIQKFSDYNFILAEQREILPYSIDENSLAADTELPQSGGLLSINGIEINSFTQAIKIIRESEEKITLVVSKPDGGIQEEIINMPNENFIDGERKIGLFPYSSTSLPLWDEEDESEIKSLQYFIPSEEIENDADIPSVKAGLPQEGYIRSINDEVIFTREDLVKVLNKNESEKVEVDIIDNDGDIETYSVQLGTKQEVETNEGRESNVLVGIQPNEIDYEFDISLPSLYYLDYADNKAVSGVAHTINILGYQSIVFRDLIVDAFQGEPELLAQSVASPIKVGDAVFNLVELEYFLNIINLTALISATLAFMNILPIPLIDGGQIVILTIERIIGRPLSLAVQNWLGRIGFLFVMGLGVVVLLKDFWQVIISRIFF